MAADQSTSVEREGGAAAAPPDHGSMSLAGRLATARPFLSLLLVGFLGRLGYEMVRSPITALYARQLGAPLAVIGLLVAGVTITGIFVKLPSGALADVFGFKRLIVTGSVVKATAPFLYLPVRTWQWLLPVRLFHGLATAIYAPAASALVASIYARQRAQRLGIYSAAENAGIVLGPALGGFVLYASTFNVAFLVAGAIGIMALLVALSVPVDRPAEEPSDAREPVLRRVRRGVLEIVSSPPILITGAVEGVMFLGFGTLQAYLPLYAAGIHLNTAEIGLLFAVQGVLSIFGRPVMGSVSDRIGRPPLIVAGIVVCAGTIVLIPHIVVFGPLLVVSALFGLGMGGVTPSTTATIADLSKARRYGAAMGVFGSIWDTGHATGPVLAGILVGAFGYQPAFLVIGIIMAASLVPFITIVTRTTGPVPRGT